MNFLVLKLNTIINVLVKTCYNKDGDKNEKFDDVN